MRKIVIIRSHYPDVRAEKVAETLARNGYVVTLIVWDRGRSLSLGTNNNHSYGVKKFRLKVSPDSLKVAFYLPIWWLFVMLQLLIERWDVVHAADFDTFIPALFMAKIKRKPIIYDIFDFYADMIGFPILPGLSRKITAKIDKALMKFADVIILPDEFRIEQIGINTNKKPVVIINNSPKEGILSGITRKKFSDKGFTIFYGGGVAKERGIIDMCLAVKDLHDVQLPIMGPCSPSFEAELQEVCKNIGNVRLHLKWIPHEEIIAQTINADLLFALYDPAVPNNRYASPNKLFEAMMCGKNIVVSDNSSMTDIVRRENCGVIVPYGDVEAIRKAIVKLKSDPDLRQKLGANGRRAYEERYSWGIMEQRLLALYQQINCKSKPVLNIKSNA
ncbi:MAG: Alpha-maltose-1-phosphate synthase [Syntrophomonadaceae bacterium]|nr:Alpha-maltose-1-phosphate synthase [Bacillota bacterium]